MKNFAATKFELNKLLEYRDGDLFYKPRDFGHKSFNPQFAGKKAGHINQKGYVSIKLFKKKYQAHRLVWIMHNGDIPEELTIDHIDNNKVNNKIQNLQILTRSDNAKKFWSNHKRISKSKIIEIAL